MSFHTFTDFIEMGGHGFYIWSAYAITLIVFIANVLRARSMSRAVLRQQKQALIIERSLSDDIEAEQK